MLNIPHSVNASSKPKPKRDSRPKADVPEWPLCSEPGNPAHWVASFFGVACWFSIGYTLSPDCRLVDGMHLDLFGQKGLPSTIGSLFP